MERILDRVKQPRPILRGLSHDELETLCTEIREFLVDTVEEIGGGGHLASNLGVVELTVALHRVFDTPRDQLIWDVSHQTYVHKMLTGRKSAMNTIRQSPRVSGVRRPPRKPT
ncbi:MAG: 1-deoxy-D-xylulose-5-phosphate synthase N-terminal domain-containing protein [Dehalococcoidia bacterium]|nr:1-deoxy-D-xylulose-5-phosphate synthase N-terminal domain-containing protein [Dehalococcoidia bacterium]